MDNFFVNENVTLRQISMKQNCCFQVMLRLQDSGDVVDQEKFIKLWKKELEQCNYVLDDEYFNVKYFSRLAKFDSQ